MQVQSYLFFDGRCEEALQFYASAIGAKVEVLMRFKDNPDQPAEGCAPGQADKVMHASFRIGESVVMASDGMAPAGKPAFQGFSLTLEAKDEAECDRLFNALAKGGQVQMPLGRTFFSPRFGVVADRFGLSWMVIVPQPA